MGSNQIKVISEVTNSKNILSMQVEEYGGYSPYHVTENNGFLGSHIDHSSIKNGQFKHVQTPYFTRAVNGRKAGEVAILFSRNGLQEKVK